MLALVCFLLAALDFVLIAAGLTPITEAPLRELGVGLALVAFGFMLGAIPHEWRPKRP